MNRILFAIAGICAAAVGFLVWNAQRAPDVEELAHTLEEAWADHHTAA